MLDVIVLVGMIFSSVVMYFAIMRGIDIFLTEDRGLERKKAYQVFSEDLLFLLRLKESDGSIFYQEYTDDENEMRKMIQTGCADLVAVKHELHPAPAYMNCMHAEYYSSASSVKDIHFPCAELRDITLYYDSSFAGKLQELIDADIIIRSRRDMR